MALLLRMRISALSRSRPEKNVIVLCYAIQSECECHKDNTSLVAAWAIVTFSNVHQIHIYKEKGEHDYSETIFMATTYFLSLALSSLIWSFFEESIFLMLWY